MEDKTSELPAEKEVLFQIPAGGLHVLLASSKHSANQLSPVVGLRGGTAVADFEGMEEIRQHASFETVKQLLLRPDIRIEHRYGGMNTALSIFSTFALKEGGEVLVAFPERHNAMLLRLYDSIEEYMQWWTLRLLSRVNNAVSNFLPPPLSIPSFIYGLHAIDCYRRYTYTTALEYEPEAKPQVQTVEFNRTLANSIKSFDLRWLLPSFFALTPDLEELKFEPGEADLEALIRRTLLVPAVDEKHGNVFYFGEVGEYLGAEFMRSWELSIGCAARAIVNGHPATFYRSFIAPTALSNHTFRLEEIDGKPAINHQSMTFDNLCQHFLDAVTHPSFPETRRPTQLGVKKLDAQMMQCLPCSRYFSAPALFCSYCGGKLVADSNAVDKKLGDEKPSEGKNARSGDKADFERLARKLQEALDHGVIDSQRFKKIHAKFKARSEDGAIWTVGLKSLEWFTSVNGKWQKASAPDNLTVEPDLRTEIESIR